MKQNSINGLAMAYVHKDIDIDLDEILKMFCQKYTCCLDFGM